MDTCVTRFAEDVVGVDFKRKTRYWLKAWIWLILLDRVIRIVYIC